MHGVAHPACRLARRLCATTLQAFCRSGLVGWRWKIVGERQLRWVGWCSAITRRGVWTVEGGSGGSTALLGWSVLVMFLGLIVNYGEIICNIASARMIVLETILNTIVKTQRFIQSYAPCLSVGKLHPMSCYTTLTRTQENIYWYR